MPDRKRKFKGGKSGKKLSFRPPLFNTVKFMS
jgi:hypothetical protein